VAAIVAVGLDEGECHGGQGHGIGGGHPRPGRPQIGDGGAEHFRAALAGVLDPLDDRRRQGDQSRQALGGGGRIGAGEDFADGGAQAVEFGGESPATFLGNRAAGGGQGGESPVDRLDLGGRSPGFGGGEHQALAHRGVGFAQLHQQRRQPRSAKGGEGLGGKGDSPGHRGGLAKRRWSRQSRLPRRTPGGRAPASTRLGRRSTAMQDDDELDSMAYDQTPSTPGFARQRVWAKARRWTWISRRWEEPSASWKRA